MTCVLCLSDLIQLLAFLSRDLSQPTLSCTLCSDEMRSQTSSDFGAQTPYVCSDKTCFSCSSSSSCFKMILSCCWTTSWVITSPLCDPRDWAFVHYKMDLTSWTCSPPEVLLTSTLLLPLTHSLLTSDGQRGVNPWLLWTPAIVKKGVTQEPFWLGERLVVMSTCAERVHVESAEKIFILSYFIFLKIT